MFTYQNKMIRGAWVDANGTQYPSGWVEGATPEQLAEIGVQVVPDVPAPEHNTETHRATQLDDGTWQVLEVVTLAEMVERKNRALEAAYNAEISADIEFTTAAGVTKMFQADFNSRSAMHDTLAGTDADGETPPGFFWKASDNTLVAPFTRADLMGLSKAMFYRGAGAFAALTQLKAQAALAQSADDLTAIQW
jgi:hypothetical protein